MGTEHIFHFNTAMDNVPPWLQQRLGPKKERGKTLCSKTLRNDSRLLELVSRSTRRDKNENGQVVFDEQR